MSVGFTIVGQPYTDYGPDPVGPPLLPHFNVRVYGHAGVQRIPQVLQPQFSGNTTEIVAQPYLWAQKVTVLLSGAAATTVAVVPDFATMVIIEVPDGQAIRAEFNSPQRLSPVTAGATSKIFTGFSIFSWMPGTVLSMVSAASFL